jgi:hypothetical protein
MQAGSLDLLALAQHYALRGNENVTEMSAHCDFF